MGQRQEGSRLSGDEWCRQGASSHEGTEGKMAGERLLLRVNTCNGRNRAMRLEAAGV